MWCLGFLTLAIALPSLIQAELCAYVLTKDCAFVADSQDVCGTDGKTYRNTCFLAKAYCENNSIHKLHDGPCVVVTTTPKPTTTPTPIDGGMIALDIFCLDLNYINCPMTGPRVCGTDGNYYTNVCEFDKARCFHREMTNGNNCS